MFKLVCLHGQEKVDEEDDIPYVFVSNEHALKIIRDHYRYLCRSLKIIVGANISGSSYKTILDDIIDENCNRGRRDYILNGRSKPHFEPPPTVTVQNEEEFKNACLEEGSTITIPEDVSQSMYESIVKLAEQKGVYVGGVFKEWWNQCKCH